MAFHVGQKVVCVEAPRGTCGGLWTSLPVKDGVYTIRALVRGNCVLLRELKNPIGPSGIERSFWESRFRPVVERKTDISIFTEMLKPKQRQKVLCGND